MGSSTKWSASSASSCDPKWEKRASIASTERIAGAEETVDRWIRRSCLRMAAKTTMTTTHTPSKKKGAARGTWTRTRLRCSMDGDEDALDLCSCVVGVSSLTVVNRDERARGGSCCVASFFFRRASFFLPMKKIAAQNAFVRTQHLEFLKYLFVTQYTT